MKDARLEYTSKEIPYTDKEINEVAEWMEGLTFEQIIFLKNFYDSFLILNASEFGNGQIH